MEDIQKLFETCYKEIMINITSADKININNIDIIFNDIKTQLAIHNESVDEWYDDIYLAELNKFNDTINYFQDKYNRYQNNHILKFDEK